MKGFGFLARVRVRVVGSLFGGRTEPVDRGGVFREEAWRRTYQEYVDLERLMAWYRGHGGLKAACLNLRALEKELAFYRAQKCNE